MSEAAESGAALNFLYWAQEGVDSLERINYHILSASRVFFGKIGSLVSRLVG